MRLSMSVRIYASYLWNQSRVFAIERTCGLPSYRVAGSPDWSCAISNRDSRRHPSKTATGPLLGVPIYGTVLWAPAVQRHLGDHQRRVSLPQLGHHSSGRCRFLFESLTGVIFRLCGPRKSPITFCLIHRTPSKSTSFG
jgi:hypothetical protein